MGLTLSTFGLGPILIMKTLIGINNLTQIDQLAYANHIQFFYRLGKELPNDQFLLCNPRRMSIDRMRNEAAKIAMELDCDYLMFIDDDVLIPFHAFQMLQHHDKDICAGVTHIRGYPFHPMIFDFKDKKNSYVVDYAEKADKETKLLEVDAVGFSCCLIKVALLKRMLTPFFVTGLQQTEDVYFCQRAKEQFPETSIFVDVSVETGHILGSDIIDPKSVEFWKTFEESRIPALKEEVEKDEKRWDRSKEYIESQMGIKI